ncbi:MgtC/SapB family protein [Ruania halotolerans]|uniref:MgtC/SapB family protein n=1 Tax=Ruania halotolerans TaxID=2897773 RepID=UPI001E2C57A6|nr:MgtC/SapB family protein [Ruania halotolerans]UFU06767.1 MgtC/SapB family protein [Ruania halotolerans]
MDIVWFSETTLTELTLLGLAFVLSAAIGLERQRRLKSAGLRTHTLVGVGTAVFTLVSAYGFQGLTGPDAIVDPSRIAAQIVSGIGFLGAGVIFVRQNIVSGLTTAASIWVTASIGMACGAGAPALAIVATVLYMIAVWGLGKLGRRLRARALDTTVLIRYREGFGALRRTLALAAEYGFEALVAESRNTSKAGKPVRVQATIELRSQNNADVAPFLSAAADVTGVRSVEFADVHND